MVANQIAAGEVIENPSSVVKELLENAYDAKANTISIDIGFGGLNQIKISDNGIGMVSEDLPLAIAPHATSKLTELGDLASLTSMGFRGEALASIAAVSRVTLSSKPSTQDTAMMLVSDGEDYQLSPCARSQGTTIDVRDLFFNAPVRRRFLRSERSEYLAIEQVVKRFALSAPSIAITLRHNGKPMLELPAATCEQTQRARVQKIFGKAFIDNACFLETEHGELRLTGWVSGDGYQRSQNDKQWFYLNQRMVKDKLILHAFKQAYDNRLYPGRHPACLLYLTLPTAEVDVNVHPTKHEVRFQQPRLIHDFVHQQVAEALAHIALPPVQEEELCVDSSLEVSPTGPDFSVIPPYQTNHTLREPPQRSPLILRETYASRPTSSYAHVHHTIAWMVLNSSYGLIPWKTEHYLFNINRAQQEQARFLLEQSTKPLSSRPLLVPVRIEMDDHARAGIALWK